MRLLVVLVAACLPLAFAPPAQAGWSSDPIQLTLTEHLIHNPVDRATWCGDCLGEDYTTGSPWTVNPGWVPGYVPPIDTPGGGPSVMDGCLWDTDDTYLYETSGNVMDAGQVLAFDECIWQGPNNRRNGGQNNYGIWRSPSPDAVIRYEYAWAMTDGSTRTVSYTVPGPESVSKGVYTYRACVRAPSVIGGVLVAVPGSHDGDGVYQVLTVTVTNTAGKVAKTGGFFGSDPRDTSTYCAGGTVDPT
jgi:hypothetical protein